MSAELGARILAGATTLDWNQEAAARLLVEHGYWLGRTLIQKNLIEDDGPDGAAWIQWRLVADGLTEVRASSSEKAMLRMACSLAGAGDEWSLAAMMRPLDHANAAAAVEAVRYAVQGPR